MSSADRVARIDATLVPIVVSNTPRAFQQV